MNEMRGMKPLQSEAAFVKNYRLAFNLRGLPVMSIAVVRFVLYLVQKLRMLGAGTVASDGRKPHIRDRISAHRWCCSNTTDTNGCVPPHSD